MKDLLQCAISCELIENLDLRKKKRTVKHSKIKSKKTEQLTKMIVKAINEVSYNR